MGMDAHRIRCTVFHEMNVGENAATIRNEEGKIIHIGHISPVAREWCRFHRFLEE